jgi:tRNA(fMet)-specific endonuclease VapC
MIYLLDTNVWARYLNQSDTSVRQRIEAADPAALFLCSIVKAEMYFGADKSPRRQANLLLLEKLFSRFASLPFDDSCAEIYGRIRADLAARGQPIGPNDLLIAATALANDVTLVTHNTGEFSRVSGLRLEDWQV